MNVNNKTGALLTVTAIAFWGLLPVVSKGILDAVDAYTLNFYRFIVAIFVLGAYIRLKNISINLKKLTTKHFLLLACAVTGLFLNHIMYMDALNHIPPSASQIIIQLGPISLLVISVFFLGETFKKTQWLGVIIFILGLILFFYDRLFEVLAVRSSYAFGIFYMSAAALIWVLYGLGQKLLTGIIPSVFILLCCYCIGSIVLLPTAKISAALQLNTMQLLLLSASCLTSLIAYICFGEALTRWEASKISALLAFIPLATLFFEHIFAWFFPDHISAESLSLARVFGAAMVITGCLFVTCQPNPKKQTR